MGNSMEGKVAFVTGAARGQGRSHAVRLAEEGADIIAIDICAKIESSSHSMGTEADLAETAKLVEALDRRIVTRVADVRERAQLAAAVEAGVAELGRLDVVVANAGISPMGPDVPVIGFFDVLSVNLCGVINTVEAAFPHLGPGASIVCTGSMAALMPGAMDSPEAGPGAAAYGHAKREVARFVHDTALQLARHSIRVNAVHPGNIETDMLHHDAMYRLFRPDLENPTRDDALPAFGAMHKMPVTTIPPRDISEAVLFFASDASRFVTGAQLRVDAGALLPMMNSGAPA
ncbi:mycofactocin-coupled SDR family oxidoreductase [Trujillonella endophytica]|uniref:SDR family mycofactocin-dependent oxidoreductase n=1 Tax=Trujillonella endophytica TaxID=673521 RepID=A0A1H8UNU6_9ACTN|nr:mycofactocin-coupled SDR family oxidoreductase [Trujillella endophytica]SEP04890.1 SDR family mycofactocin-dependent oxidoreductase [Trujillella endophytica]